MIDWRSALVEPFLTVWDRLVTFLPTLIGVLVILIVGVIIAKILESVVVKVLKLIKLDMASEKAGIASFLAKGEIKHTLSEIIGALVYWVVILVTLVTVANALGLTVAAQMLDDIVKYIPNVVAALFILILGVFFATLLGTIVKTAASNAGISIANMLGRVSQVIIVVFTIAVALGQLNIAASVINIMISITLGSIGLGAAIAIGFGCKDIAGRYINELIERLKRR